MYQIRILDEGGDTGRDLADPGTLCPLAFDNWEQADAASKGAAMANPAASFQVYMPTEATHIAEFRAYIAWHNQHHGIGTTSGKPLDGARCVEELLADDIGAHARHWLTEFSRRYEAREKAEAADLRAFATAEAESYGVPQ